jgi:hypothetical protein
MTAGTAFGQNPELALGGPLELAAVPGSKLN